MSDQTAPGGPSGIGGDTRPGEVTAPSGPPAAVPPPLPSAVADVVEELDDEIIPELIEDLDEELEEDGLPEIAPEIVEDLGEVSIDPVALADVAAQLADEDEPAEFAEAGYDRTTPVLKPALAVAIDDTVELLTAELGALARAGSDASPTAIEDINLRLALFVWDIFTDDESAAQYLTRAGNHPLAPALVLGLGIETRDAERVAWAERALMASRTDDRRRAYAALDAAEVWLYHMRDAAHAAESSRAGLALRIDSKTTGALRAVHHLALAVGGEFAELSPRMTEVARAPRANVGDVAEAAHIAYDRLGNARAAAELLAPVIGRIGERSHSVDADVTVQFRVLRLAAELQAGEPALSELVGDHPSLFRRLLAVVEAVPDARADAAAVRYSLAAATRAVGEALEANDLMGPLLVPDPNPGGDWGPRLALLTYLEAMVAAGEWSRAIGTLRQLARRPGAGALASAYRWRAAEILDARVGASGDALDLWRELLAEHPGSGQAGHAIERLLLAGNPADTGPLIAHYQAAAEAEPDAAAAWLRRAAAVAESQLGDIARAVFLQAQAVELEDLPRNRYHLARLFRRQHERSALSGEYRKLARAARDRRVSAALLCGAGAIDLAQGNPVDAEEAFAAAARHAPEDPAARAGLAHIFRQRKRWRELAHVLSELGPLLVERASRVDILRELADIYSDRLQDRRRGRLTLEQALEFEPDDVPTLHKLAQLYDRARDWGKGVELRRRALELLTASGGGPELSRRRAGLLLEIGEIEETRRGNTGEALRAYEAAFAADSTSVEALRAQSRIYRKDKHYDRLLQTLQAELALAPAGERRVEIQLEIATLHGDGALGARDSGASLDAYMRVLEVEPDNQTALSGVETIGRVESKWEEIATAFGRAPPTPDNLEVLAEALSHMERWDPLAQVRARQLELVSTNAERVRLAHELGEIYEHRLGRVEDAIAMYRRAVDVGPQGISSLGALTRILRQHARWPELAQAYETELRSLPPDDRPRQIDSLLRLGALRRDHLSRPADAVVAFESVLELAPRHVPALEALESLYQHLGRDKDLLRVTLARAEATDGDTERAQLYARVAELRAARGEIDEALDAFRRAFLADPANRVVFTEMEKLCYQHERWDDAMALYTTAIEQIERGESRAYRLGDLYARKGQVQLQYLGDLGAAAKSYSRVLELDPDNDTAIKFIESIYSRQGSWDDLIDAYESRADLTTDDDRRIETLRKAALVATSKLSNPAEAARIYSRMVEIDPSNAEALDALESFYERDREWDRLVEVLGLRLATTTEGDDTTALLKRIAQICEDGLRDPKRAVEYYRRIVDIAPGNKDALEALGRIYESTEKWAEFVDVTRRQIRITTDRNVKALLYFKCGSVMEAKFGKEEDAIRYYDAAIKTAPSCLPAVHGLRDLYRRREDWPRVIQTLELEVKLWQDDKERAGVFAQIGKIYDDQLGQPDRAMHYYDSALAVDPDCLPANKALFEHFVDHEMWDRALPLAHALSQKAMREGEPTARSEFYRKRGIVAQKMGDGRMGAESMIIALEIKPTNIEALDALGAIAREYPDAYDFAATYRELEKIYRKREDSTAHLARVWAARAAFHEREGEFEQAEQLYRDAVELVPTDFAVLSALVDLHVNLRHWTEAVLAIRRFLSATPPPPDDIRVTALMRQVEILADGAIDPEQALAVVSEVLAIEPMHQDAYYRLAQEHCALGQYDAALAAVERVIELAASPGAPLSPQALARFYYYKGRILELSGDSRSATSQYRRASEYDPGYAPPALVLAKRAYAAGDQPRAEKILIDSAEAAMAAQGPRSAVPMQRGLARILLASGDHAAAIEAYRGILNVEPDNAADRVALAEIYAYEDVPKAIAELKKVIRRDIYHAPAYRQLASFYSQIGERERAARVISVMEMLGFVEDADRDLVAKARATIAYEPLRRQLDDKLRSQFLLTDVARGPVGEVFALIARNLTALFPSPDTGESLRPIQSEGDSADQVALADMVRLFGIDPEVYVARNVPGGAALLSFPQPILVIDRELLREDDGAKRFLLGWASEGIRGGYALLFSIGRRHRAELGSLVRSLFSPHEERPSATVDFINTLSPEAISLIEHYTEQGVRFDPGMWMDGLLASAKRAGLFACNDFEAATRMISRLAGEDAASSAAGMRALGAVLGGPDLIRFYLSDDFHGLREILSQPLPEPIP